MKRFFASYIFILVPFVVLIITKLVISKPEDVLVSTDWSIASFMIIAQSMSVIVSDNFGNKRINLHGMIIFVGITIILLVICLGVYAYAIAKPNMLTGYFQVGLFILSSIWMCGIYKASEYISLATND